eukprot:TRINITY_DN2247_c1_g1_i1.p1 TRINITY_DN2247_c1_g1~~TRINITY_DN2247_c1_g1_i1.p1  ORF type:complete len:248 (+),score=67.62 TRINITY_DN2247_c1_g1_i1:155-898(+)
MLASRALLRAAGAGRLLPSGAVACSRLCVAETARPVLCSRDRPLSSSSSSSSSSPSSFSSAAASASSAPSSSSFSSASSPSSSTPASVSLRFWHSPARSSFAAVAPAVNARCDARLFSNRYIRAMQEKKALEEAVPVPPPQYETREITEADVTPSGWSPPMGVVDKRVPFWFPRTASKLLPVYRRYRNGRTRVMTVIRHCNGDREAFVEELNRVLGGDVRIEERAGTIEVQGDHKREVSLWLRKLGF